MATKSSFDEEFFEVGQRYCNRKGWYEVIEKKDKDTIKIRYEENGLGEWINGLDILKRIHENILREVNIWWICHQEDLWLIDNRMIGFWRKNQWDIFEEENTVIYYRIGSDQIMGVFKIINKGININPAFKSSKIHDDTKYQCRLDLLSDDIICAEPRKEKRFSFYNSWSSQRFGGLKVQIFAATKTDLSLILRIKGQ